MDIKGEGKRLSTKGTEKGVSQATDYIVVFLCIRSYNGCLSTKGIFLRLRFDTTFYSGLIKLAKITYLYKDYEFMISAELTRLDAQALEPVLKYILDAFEGLTFDPGDCPKEQFALKLSQLESPASHLKIIHITSTLDAFSYRVHTLNKNGLPEYWNPLHCTFEKFFPERRKVVTQSNTEFPSSDIIYHFCCNFLKNA